MTQPRRKSLSRQVMESIEQMILEQQLGPGDVLPTETQIADQLQVSKSSVREAVKMLEALGLVEIRRGLCTVISENPQRGFLNVLMSQLYLHSGSTDDLRVFRQVIEAACTNLAMETATDSDLQLVRQALEQFRRKVEQGALEVEDDIHFHMQIVQATHNTFLVTLASALYSLFRDSIRHSIQENPRTALHDHERIFQAFLDRDSSAATKAIRESADAWAPSIHPKSTRPLGGTETEQ